MHTPDLLIQFIVWGLYPAWLLAGMGDYLCHRRTDIGHTSGPHESWLHLAQFATLLGALTAWVLLEPGTIVFGLLVSCVLAHSALSMVDVAYTMRRRHISAFEQFVHSFMDVLPIVAVALVILAHWQQRTAGVQLREIIDPSGLALLASFVLLAGTPIFEELIRTSRQSGNLRYQAGFASPH